MPNARSKEIVLVIGFLAMVATPGIIQTVVELRRGESVQALAVFRQRPTAKNLREYERELEDSSWVAQQLRPWMQFAQFRILKEAGDKALVGRDGWLFYQPGVRYLTERPAAPRPGEPPHDPRAAIVDLRDQLAARGIPLLVMIAPNKESVYPQMLAKWSGSAAPGQVLMAAQTRQLLADLQAAGVEVVDLFEVFRAARQSPAAATTAPLYLAQDTHWSPAGLELAAKATAEKILAAGWVQRGTVAYELKPAPVRRLGDVIRMLQVPQIEQEFAPENISCRQVIRQDDRTPYRDDPNAGNPGSRRQLPADLRTGRAPVGRFPRAPGVRTGPAGGFHRQRRRGVHAGAAGPASAPAIARRQEAGDLGVRRTRHPLRHRGLAARAPAAMPSGTQQRTQQQISTDDPRHVEPAEGIERHEAGARRVRSFVEMTCQGCADRPFLSCRAFRDSEKGFNSAGVGAPFGRRAGDGQSDESQQGDTHASEHGETSPASRP